MRAKILRCSIHGYDFPVREDFIRCPECGERCVPFSEGEPMTDEEANSILAHARFEAYLQERAQT